ncbi:MAG: saccharopine dehydrogenase NADP-binding domain-containing protein [Achromobacter sp.]|uniref:saccharopine dehydrogenase NADP-binding domain-containing protein n=1 Tax=Achromobacter sp. TaxID=134375 RepID=UPI003D05365F
MTAPMIGILGASGAVGSTALASLVSEGRYVLRAGYRSRPPRGDTTSCVERQQVDVDDEASLARFCKSCSVVLNAAGPSCRIGDRVARAADAAGAHYVDAFGGALLVQQLTTLPLSPERCVIHSAGVYPGLSALLPRWMAGQGFDLVLALRGWAGGRERCTPAAAADVLLSTVQGFGQAGTAWVEGRRMAGALAPRDAVEVVGFPGRVRVQPFFSEELEQLVVELGLHDAQWNNVMPGARTIGIISRWRSRLGTPESIDETWLAQAVAELVQTAQLDVAGQTPYYRLVIEMEGVRAEQPHHLRAVLRAPDSYCVSGAVAASAALCLLDAPPEPGVHSADRVLVWNAVRDRLQTWGVIEAFNLVELSADDIHAATTSVEEGAL